MNRVVLYIALLSLRIVGADIGSDTAVTRFNNQQIVQDTDRIAGFASLAGGFALANSFVTGTFDCFFPVSGNIAFNYGTLLLSQDLIFSNVSFIRTMGNVNGAGHAMILAPSMNPIPSEAMDCSISFLTSFNAAAQINSVDWNITSTYIAIGMTTAAATELQVFSWNGTSISSITGAAFTQNVNSVNWHPTNSWIAVARNGAAGDELYNYSFNGATLTNLSSLSLGNTNFNEVEWRPDGLYMGVATASAGSQLRVYPVNSGTGAIGVAVTANTTQTANTVSWNFDGTYLIVGTISGTNELQVYASTGATVTTPANATFDVGALAVNSVSWNKYGSNTAIIAVGIAATVAPAKSLRLFRHVPTNATAATRLVEIPTTIEITTAVNSVDWSSDGSCLAVGLSTGTPAGEVRTYQFINNDLTLNSDIQNASNVLSVKWSRDGRYLATGDVATDLELYRLDGAFIDITNVLFNEIYLYMNSDLTLRDVSITFSGESLFDGRGNTLTLAPTFSLVVKEGSSLLLKDMTITGVNDSKLRCLSSASTFSFQDVTLVLDGDFTFSLGKLDILRDLKITGSNCAFIYTSNSQSTIRGGTFGTDSCAPKYCGALIIDSDTTFSYRPANNDSTLLNMESSISKIILNSGTLSATTLSLTKGMLQIEGNSILQAVTGITLGDGTAANNVDIEIMPAANLQIMGNITYNNV